MKTVPNLEKQRPDLVSRYFSYTETGLMWHVLFFKLNFVAQCYQFQVTLHLRSDLYKVSFTTLGLITNVSGTLSNDQSTRLACY